MTYLLDTDVLSLLRRADRHPGLVQWLQDCNPHHLYLSVVSIGEIERGIDKQRSLDPAFAHDLAIFAISSRRRSNASILSGSC